MPSRSRMTQPSNQHGRPSEAAGAPKRCTALSYIALLVGEMSVIPWVKEKAGAQIGTRYHYMALNACHTLDDQGIGRALNGTKCLSYPGGPGNRQGTKWH
eukprot:1161343-Pelagomonas_calceolata.AAC.8